MRMFAILFILYHIFHRFVWWQCFRIVLSTRAYTISEKKNQNLQTHSLTHSRSRSIGIDWLKIPYGKNTEKGEPFINFVWYIIYMVAVQDSKETNWNFINCTQWNERKWYLMERMGAQGKKNELQMLAHTYIYMSKETNMSTHTHTQSFMLN